MEDRDQYGRFVKGEWKGGPGRPPKASENQYRHVFSECVTLERFRASCQQVWLDSVGKMITPEGKLVNDPSSTPHARLHAFARIAGYILGGPVQSIIVESSGENKLWDFFDSLSDEQLERIIAKTEHLLEDVVYDKALPRGESRIIEADSKDDSTGIQNKADNDEGLE